MRMSTNGNGLRHAPAAGKHLNTGVYVKSKNGRKLRDIAVRRLTQKMRIAMPWIEDSDLPVCRAWAEMELLSTRMYAELKAKGLLNAQGEARRLVNDYRTMRHTQMGFARELGMTPSARLALRQAGMHSAVDIDVSAATTAQVIEIGTARKAQTQSNELKNDDEVK
jgi:phage terminase small subunit